MRETSIEVSGKTEDDAIQTALRQLGMDRDEVSVEIVERAKSGFLGIGASPAVVRVTYMTDEPEAAPAAAPEPAPAAPKAPEAAPTAKAAPVAAAAGQAADAVVSGAPEDKARQFLTGLFEKMDVTATAEIRQVDGMLQIELTGPNMGPLIGRRGETLDAIQHLTNYVVNRGVEKRTRVSIDAENYRQKREEALVRLAQKVAGKVVRYRKNMSLEPMNSYERHVIHTALQDMENVTTYSTGTEPNRRVVIAYNRSSSSGRRDAASSTGHREWS